MPLKYNPYTQRYEYAEEDMEPTYNELSLIHTPSPRDVEESRMPSSA